MQPHLFLMDVDGTLLRGGMGISDAVKESVRDFRRAGGKLALCTGRSWVSTAWIAKELDIDIPCVLFTGAALWDFTAGRAVEQCLMDPAALEAVANVPRDHPEISVQAYTTDGIFIVNHTPYLERKCVREELDGMPRVSSISEIHGGLFKLVFSCPDIDELAAFGKAAFDPEDTQFAFASTHFAEVVSAQAGKAVGAARLMERLGVPAERCFAAGDGMTDLPVLQLVGHSFAPEDAAPAVLSACTEPMPRCEDDGIAAAFRSATARMNA